MDKPRVIEVQLGDQQFPAARPVFDLARKFLQLPDKGDRAQVLDRMHRVQAVNMAMSMGTRPCRIRSRGWPRARSENKAMTAYGFETKPTGVE